MDVNKIMTCVREDIDENFFMYTGCKTSVGELKEVLFCPEGIYISFDKLQFDIRIVCRRLREILQTQYIYIYVIDHGYYDYFQGKYIKMEYDTFFDETFNEIYLFSDEEIKIIEKRLRTEDAQIRGSYMDNEGNIYIKKGNVFRPISNLNSNKIYYFCLFGGTLGLHRFYLKKYFTGIIYLLSAGCFGAGYLTDILTIILGSQLDKKKRLLRPLENKTRVMLWLPVGITINLIYFKLFINFISNI